MSCGPRNTKFSCLELGITPKVLFYRMASSCKTNPDAIQTLLKSAVLCSDATIKLEGNSYSITGDPTEVALIVAAAKANLNAEDLNGLFPRVDVVPFDSENQYMATLVGKNSPMVILKGAPEVILRRCTEHLGGFPLMCSKYMLKLNSLGRKGMRVLAVAQKRAMPTKINLQLTE
jgi:magnesium-transporting ATPase (P-type)